MDRWFELRTIAAVAQYGTVSAAARALRLHRATVLRHVDLMEESLGVRLFLRHARGYTPTAAALELSEVAERAQTEIDKIASTEQDKQTTGSGLVTITATSLMAQIFMPYVAAELRKSPGLFMKCVTGTQFEALEGGNADIAIRVGQKPSVPEYVVQPLGEIRFGLYGSKDYIARKGRPKDTKNLGSHVFAGPLSDGPRVGPLAWLLDNIAADNIRLRSDDAQVLATLILEGHALGTLPIQIACRYGMVPVIVEPGLFSAPLWVVTHRDVHRMKRVQVCLAAIKSAVKSQGFPPVQPPEGFKV
ncbi:MAG: LysR family transcriptional regulator [Pseudomonadota bacterium]